MKKPMIRIHNTELNEIIDREMTDDEYKTYLIVQEEEENRIKILNAKNKKREEALAKLAALGLTEDEIAAL